MPDLGKRALSKRMRREQILIAALDEFEAYGYFGARIDRIASTVGISSGAIYFHFESKETLFFAVIGKFAPSIEPITTPDTNTPIAATLADYLRYLHTRITADPVARNVLHLVVAEGRHFPQFVEDFFTDFMEPALAGLRSLLEIGIERGELRETALLRNPEILLSPAVLANNWTVTFKDRRPLDQEAYLDTYISLFLNGICLPPQQ